MEENAESGPVLASRERTETIVGWAVVAFLVALMFLRVALAMWTIGDRPRPYEYRSAPLIPAEAYSSTMPAAATTENAPRQVELPPPAVGKQAPASRASGHHAPTGRAR